MSFFNDVSRQFGGYGQKAAQRTRDMSETMKLNSQISQEEKILNNLYFKIGSLYYSLHSEDCEEALSELVNAVIASKEKIELCKKRVLILKGVRICVKCGAEISAESVFCNACGALQPKETPAAAGLICCPACEAAVKPGAKFCTSCGNPMPADAPAEKSVCLVCGAAVKPGAKFCTSCGNPMPADAPAKKSICPNCGKELEAEAKFCSGCGNTILSAENTQVKKVICSNCGKELAEGTKFCTDCGEKTAYSVQEEIKPELTQEVIIQEETNFELKQEAEIREEPNLELKKEAVIQEEPKPEFIQEAEMQPVNITGNKTAADAEKAILKKDIYVEKAVQKTSAQGEKCLFCGAKIREGIKFCTKCGKKIRE